MPTGNFAQEDDERYPACCAGRLLNTIHGYFEEARQEQRPVRGGALGVVDFQVGEIVQKGRQGALIQRKI